ncbi:MAG TPA: Ig-like domain-containing protein [Candidatus Saccharimonadales bacterium]|nr:Ig-like domain-containing protein [Candidatus Saccharimonadales bacterium]
MNKNTGLIIKILVVILVGAFTFLLPKPPASALNDEVDLTIHNPGSPGGTVTSSPAGISCPGTCTATFDTSITPTITLTATPAAGSSVNNWEFPCASGVQTDNVCTVQLFDGEPTPLNLWWGWSSYNVQVKTAGTGSGKIVSSTGGINCTGTCTVSNLSKGTTMTITAQADSGSTFAGWDTYDDGAGACYADVGKAGSFGTVSGSSCTFSVGDQWSSNSAQTFLSGIAIFNKVSSSSPQVSSSTPVSTPKTPVSTNNSTNAPSQTATAPITLEAIQVAGVKLDASKPVTLMQSQPLVLSGTTVPNAVVTLTIHSTPRTVTTTADKNGSWSYTVTGLAPGNHYVEAAVTNPATKQTTQPIKLVSFTITSAVAAVKPAKKSGGSGALAAVIIIVVILLAGAGGYRYWRRGKNQLKAPLA